MSFHTRGNIATTAAFINPPFERSPKAERPSAGERHVQKAFEAFKFSRNIRVSGSLQCSKSSRRLKLGCNRAGYLQAVGLGAVQRGAHTWIVPTLIGDLDTTAVKHLSGVSDRRNHWRGKTPVGGQIGFEQRMDCLSGFSTTGLKAR